MARQRKLSPEMDDHLGYSKYDYQVLSRKPQPTSAACG